jgi:UDP-N-acetylglucosamine 2-epimerase (non-hydrolysing)
MDLTVILGTRPEVIKLAPFVREARRRGHFVRVVHTGQHMSLTKPLMDFFDVHEDANLEAMLDKPSLSGLSQRVLERLDEKLDAENTKWVIVQGDTTTAFIGAYWAFCKKIPVAHVEAGLRTWDPLSPYPEEINRQLIARLATLSFAPTINSRDALLKENVSPESIFVVGNTAIDSLQYTLDRIRKNDVPMIDRLPSHIKNFIDGKKLIAVTTHRRENHGETLEGICRALLRIVDMNKEACVVLPVHPNPSVKNVVERLLGSHSRIMLCDPLGYVGFIELLSAAELIITDSGGVQEEAPTLKKPILVIRDTTERPEGVAAGFAQLIGCNEEKIVEAALHTLSDKFEGLPLALNPYGDGTSAIRILNSMEHYEKEKLSVPPFSVALDHCAAVLSVDQSGLVQGTIS